MNLLQTSKADFRPLHTLDVVADCAVLCFVLWCVFGFVFVLSIMCCVVFCAVLCFVLCCVFGFVFVYCILCCVVFWLSNLCALLLPFNTVLCSDDVECLGAIWNKSIMRHQIQCSATKYDIRIHTDCSARQCTINTTFSFIALHATAKEQLHTRYIEPRSV